MNPPTRREYLGMVGSVGAIALAGCTSQQSPPSENEATTPTERQETTTATPAEYTQWAHVGPLDVYDAGYVATPAVRYRDADTGEYALLEPDNEYWVEVMFNVENTGTAPAELARPMFEVLADGEAYVWDSYVDDFPNAGDEFEPRQKNIGLPSTPETFSAIEPDGVTFVRLIFDAVEDLDALRVAYDDETDVARLEYLGTDYDS